MQTQSIEQRPQEVSFVELKKLVLKVLPAKSILRHLILSEPDTLTRTNAFAKMEILIRLLYAELGETA